MADDSADDDGAAGLFEEPPGSSDEEEVQRTVVHDRELRSAHAGQPPRLSLRLAPKHSLWGNELWNAARFVASLLDSGELDVRSKCVLELGAGAGLPSCVAAMNGAQTVTVTDYGTPADMSLLEALTANVAALNKDRAASASESWTCDVTALPFVWGKSTDLLVESLPAGWLSYDVIIGCDLLFARAAHTALLTSIDALLAPSGVAIIAFSHHDPHKAPLDMAFFELARAGPFAFAVRHCPGHQFAADVFCEHDGLDEQRSFVHHYELRRAGA